MNRVYHRPAQDAVIALMFRYPDQRMSWTKRDVATMLDWSYRQAESAVDRLAARGVLIQVGDFGPAKTWRLR